MNKETLTDIIVTAKAAKGVTWEAIATDIGVGPVWLTSVCLGMNSAAPDKAEAISNYLGLGPEVTTALQEFPTKNWEKTVATDPFIYRFYEIAGVYGESIKQVAQEKFGDGIMSAIDFTVDVAKQEDPKGDRVVITMNGKFLPYKSW